MRTQIAILALATIALVGCGTSEPTKPEGALEEMAVAFNGNPSVSSVQAALDAAFVATGTSTSEENYSRAGSTLVVASGENGVSEMDVLACIPGQVGDPRIPDDTFASVATLCALILAGDYPKTP